MPKLLTVTDLAQYLGVSRPTVYKMLQEPTFPPPLQGSLRRWNIEEVDAWRLSRSVASAAE